MRSDLVGRPPVTYNGCCRRLEIVSPKTVYKYTYILIPSASRTAIRLISLQMKRLSCVVEYGHIERSN